MKRTLFLLGFLLASLSTYADEGMWILKELNQQSAARMQELGFKFPIDSIYSEENPSLKDAVVIFGRGCTGVAVSKDGLIFTNHHCGYDAIQQHSSVEHDYLKDGFVSNTREDELYTPGLTISFLKKTEDVTAFVTAGVLASHSEKEREAIIDSLSNELLNQYKILVTDSAAIASGAKKEYKDNDFVRARIVPFFEGNKYYLVVYDVFQDVRMVLAPPSSIGKFGGDTDNWMWPRQTGDFSVFRVYADKNNQPAKHSEDNVPYHPVYSVPVALTGYDKGSYAMTIGYPGSTDRYLSSWGVASLVEAENKPRIEVRGVKQDIWKEAMDKSDEIRIKYASKFSRSSNYWKNSIGMNKAISRLKVIDQKRKVEADFAQWLSTKPDKQETYGKTLQLLDSAYSHNLEDSRARTYFLEVFNRGIEVPTFAGLALLGEMKKGEEKEKFLKEKFEENFKDYDAKLDQKLVGALLKLYRERVSDKYLPDIYKTTIDKKFNGDCDRYAEWLFSKSKLVSLGSAMNVSMKAGKKGLEKDPAVQLLSSISKMRRTFSKTFETSTAQASKGSRLFMAGLQEMNPEKAYSANANSTQRLSYGSVNGYEPQDAASYNYYSTTKGIFEKEDPTNSEFEVQEYIMENLRLANWGQYADKDGAMYVNFISNNDITGGNSGSPVFNGNAELIGLAFDGNWEALSGDIVFEDKTQRTISVDIRYVLYVIDKVMNSKRLIDELDLRK